MSRIKRIKGTSFWAGAQENVPSFLITTQNLKYVVCLRRQVPEWWEELKERYLGFIEFVHKPIPSIFHYNFEQNLTDVLDYLLQLSDYPVVFFCQQGKNRTGMLAGLINYTLTDNIDSAEKEYITRSSDCFRQKELQLIRKICSHHFSSEINGNLNSTDE